MYAKSAGVFVGSASHFSHIHRFLSNKDGIAIFIVIRYLRTNIALYAFTIFTTPQMNVFHRCEAEKMQGKSLIQKRIRASEYLWANVIRLPAYTGFCRVFFFCFFPIESKRFPRAVAEYHLTNRIAWHFPCLYDSHLSWVNVFLPLPFCNFYTKVNCITSNCGNLQFKVAIFFRAKGDVFLYDEKLNSRSNHFLYLFDLNLLRSK